MPAMYEFALNGRVSGIQLHRFGRMLDNFELYSRHSSQKTELLWLTARAAGDVVALVPVVRLHRRKTTDMLRRPLRTWMGLLGPLAKKTSLLLDTAFLAYDAVSPFFSQDGVDRTTLKRQASSFLKTLKGVDSIWIAEPREESAWAASEGFCQFATLPMALIDLDGCRDMKDYVARLSKKKRRNYRHERETFTKAGAKVEIHEGPLGDHPLLGQLLDCLRASEAHSELAVFYNDVLTAPRAFAEQPQRVLAAVVDRRIVGFMSFLDDGERLMQCHGGLDYATSHHVLAYHNLIYASIEHALQLGRRSVSMGPLNNETKRRAANVLQPMVASLWNRNPIDRLFAEKFFIKNFDVYQGDARSSAAAE